MAQFFTSLFYYAAVRNRTVEFSLGAFDHDIHPLLEFSDSRNKVKIGESLQELKTVGGGYTNFVTVLDDIKRKYRGHKGNRRRLEIIFTDGGDGSGKSPQEFNADVAKLEKDLNLDIVLIGVQTPMVTNYARHLLIDHPPTVNELIMITIQLALLKVKKGRLPQGDLSRVIHVGGGATGLMAALRRIVPPVDIPFPARTILTRLKDWLLTQWKHLVRVRLAGERRLTKAA